MQYTFVGFVALPGDFNNDGRIDVADYAVGRQGLGTTYSQADYDVSHAHFGQSAGSGSGAIANAAVPEPATLSLMIPSAVGAATLGTMANVKIHQRVTLVNKRPFENLGNLCEAWVLNRLDTHI